MFYWLYYKKEDEEILKFLNGLLKQSFSRDSGSRSCVSSYYMRFNDVTIEYVIYYGMYSYSVFYISTTKSNSTIYTVRDHYKKSFKLLHDTLFNTQKNNKEIAVIKEKYVSMSSM